ncbi:PhzF family phenazine biosynthesis protein [Emcibacter nanhaiensis]|nr:PhzF family phenazine biosynthesis protein [Emcibacter nanhaiensis]
MKNLKRIAAFSEGNTGGNPAGVMIGEEFPLDEDMQATAKEVGYSETCFLVPFEDGWRIRYFSPETEVPFCGHATIAAGAALGQRNVSGACRLYLNDRQIDIEIQHHVPDRISVALQSPETWTRQAPKGYTEQVLRHFNFTTDHLDPLYPPMIAYGGSKHLVLVVKDMRVLQNAAYEFEPVRALMKEQGLATISVVYIESLKRVCARNFFASGGVYEDAATGAAAAALAGYLRDLDWGGARSFEISQGVDMGYPSRIFVDYGETKGESVRVAGSTRFIV